MRCRTSNDSRFAWHLVASARLDVALAAGRTPDIRQIVDCTHYRYVWTEPRQIRAGQWLIDMPRGMMSDGASGVPDRCPLAWWPHDRLYLSPWAVRGGRRVLVGKRQADMIYAMQGLRAGLPIVWLEGVALATGINFPVWRAYRRRDEAELIASHIVPRAARWQFPTQMLADAVWVG